MKTMRLLATMLGGFALATAAGCDSAIEEPIDEDDVSEMDDGTEVDPSGEVPYDPGSCSSGDWQHCVGLCDAMWCGARVDNCFRAWWYDGPWCTCSGGGAPLGIPYYCGS